MQIKITSRLKRALCTALRRRKERKEAQATEHGQPGTRLFTSHQASLSRHLRDMEKGGLMGGESVRCPRIFGISLARSIRTRVSVL